jgi:subtilase family serine protease
MHKLPLRRITQNTAFILLLAGSIISSLQAQRNRISPVDSARRTAVPGSVHPRLALADDRGRVDESLAISNVTLAFAPTAEQQTALDEFLAAQQTPGSPDYHRWLTPEQYADRFGVSESDVGTIRAWLESQSLTVSGVARSRTWISVSGAARQLENAFQTELHRYDINGETHIANATAPLIPERFSGVVRAIRGLTDFRPRRSNTRSGHWREGASSRLTRRRAGITISRRTT